VNEVRIISGKWGRRKLVFPARPELRPTPDRTRETLFNWLAPLIADSRCVDLCAGSGALGFEALSRGAAHCTFVERDREAGRALIANRDRLGISGADIVRADVLVFLRETHTPWDVVFLDPPFDTALITPCLALLAVRGLVTSASRVYIEFRTRHRAQPPPALGAFRVLKSTRAGDSSAQLLVLD
jgi:16S rRNA (guanine966-N2)-methyltransferase